MAGQIIRHGLCYVDEVYGTEVGLYRPGLYAGTADLVGIYNGEPAIMDFKSARKVKRREWIQSYFHQLAAYAMAHNEGHGTTITTRVILMADRDFTFKRFVIRGDEFIAKQDEWQSILRVYFGRPNNADRSGQ